MSSGNPTERTSRRRAYDHTAFYPTLRPTDVFVCSYPKSGTTWLGFLLAHVMKTDPAEQLDLKSFNKYVPDVNLLYTKRGSLAEFNSSADPRVFLCHAAFDQHLPKVVYVVRDPRDVMVSYWHYQKFLKKDCDESLADYLAREDHWPCEWDEHVGSWLASGPAENVRLVRYEDLHADAVAVLQSVVDFAAIASTPERVRAAVEASRFEKMRSAEEKFGVHGKAGDDSERFVRKGKVGSWQEEMGPVELAILEAKYGPVMKRAGYETFSVPNDGK